jgi:flagellar basal body P-ring protein FlgI
MTQKNVFVLVIMIWLTVLTIWAVNKVVISNDNFNVSVHGIPVQPTPQPFSTVQVDKDTVWIIDNTSDMIKIITHDADGYHLTQERMSIQDHY